jgi:hypothetical protein
MLKLSDLRKAGTLLSNEFIEIMEEHWPDKAGEPSDTHDQIQQKIGAVQVIRTVKRWKEMLDDPTTYQKQETASLF